ncbi:MULTISPECIES: FAD-dependent oxidoreductase [unclassified Butyrivibrio]|uniref:FAD-dependent oxidoreductase n=1 Tax=unclassified Butyrivibrio TaxID=2639466 RepID=UPI0003B4191D|nr:MULTISPECIES: FAD-dependent oxidoreductase [unclassified Butyrivibrio]SEL27107.1 fumarate reductase flavoprotein subunit [Butyrivibrio sp. ob235]
MKQLQSDVIVVAAGLSGLAASIAAAENGASVITFEKSSTTGGAANMGMGPLGVGSRIQKDHMIALTPGEAFRKHMYFTHYRVDARMVRDYYFKSGDTIDWLMDMGVEFVGVQRAFSAPEATRAYSDGEFTWHVVKPEDGGMPGPRCATAMTKKMTERAKELGVDFQFETPVKKIIMEDGAAVGVIAVDKNGEEIEARANAVIICTGGFGDNPEMIKEQTEFEYGNTIYNFAVPGMKGDGIKMAWEAGAGHEPCIMELMYQLPDNMNHFILDGAFRQPCLWVNRNGQRFMPEDQIANTTFTGNAIAAQPGKVAYSIFDSKMLKKYKKKGPDIVSHVHPHDLFDHFDEQWNADLANGYEPIVQADTIEELAEKAGIDVEGLVAQIEEYNEMCANGFDEIFEKDRAYMQPIEKAPFYLCRENVGAYGSLGGVKINHKTQVLTQDAKVIPGLYAAGTDACNIFGDSYPFILSGNTMGFCLNSGRIAGENASAGSENFDDFE